MNPMNPSSSTKRRRWSCKSKPSQWSTLDSDVLEVITKRLDAETPLDIQRLRAVCRGWRSSIPPPNPPPSSNNDNIIKSAKLPLDDLPFRSLKNVKGKEGHLSLKQTTVYCLQPLVKFQTGRNPNSSIRNWFVKIEETESPGKVILKHPLSRMPIKTFGNINSLPKAVDLLDYRVREVAKEYRLQYVPGESRRPRDVDKYNKIVVGQKENGDFMVMTMYGRGKLIAWRMGEDKWVKIDNEFCCKDIAYHKGKFYAVDEKRRLITVECSSLEVTQVVPPTYGEFGEQQASPRSTYLVKSQEDELFLINKYDCTFLDVFKLDEESGQWDFNWLWSSDWVLFVGENGFSFSVSAEKFGGCKENCIYFSDDCFSSAWDDYPVFDADKFDFPYTFLPHKDFSPCSKLFWPPPTWLKQKPT
ncbi:F-box protein SKIP23 [Ziziphus jujuba]|uniref:F-box protein SKIP23 n=1 Tax=Ziziphus jujuba TaxID=326968 RepID=A0A6P6GEX7_ZIZJJ|nr:F-box protein SKIP23 [Ziziphus jujuba]XP_048323688.2 F-box protein SKIP23 [Ziziphus jujuba]